MQGRTGQERQSEPQYEEGNAGDHADMKAGNCQQVRQAGIADRGHGLGRDAAPVPGQQGNRNAAGIAGNYGRDPPHRSIAHPLDPSAEPSAAAVFDDNGRGDDIPAGAYTFEIGAALEIRGAGRDRRPDRQQNGAHRDDLAGPERRRADAHGEAHPRRRICGRQPPDGEIAENDPDAVLARIDGEHMAGHGHGTDLSADRRRLDAVCPHSARCIAGCAEQEQEHRKSPGRPAPHSDRRESSQRRQCQRRKQRRFDGPGEIEIDAQTDGDRRPEQPALLFVGQPCRYSPREIFGATA